MHRAEHVVAAGRQPKAPCAPQYELQNGRASALQARDRYIHELHRRHTDVLRCMPTKFGLASFLQLLTHVTTDGLQSCRDSRSTAPICTAVKISMRRRQPALHSIGDHPRCFGEPNMQVDSNIILDPRTTLAILRMFRLQSATNSTRSLAVYGVSESQACTECNQKVNGSRCLRTNIAIQCTYCRLYR